MTFPYQRLKKIHLTEKALSDFDRMQSTARPSTSRKSTKTNPYDNNFEQLLMDEGHWGHWEMETELPTNWQDLQQMLRSQPITCCVNDYLDFTRMLGRAQTETKTKSVAFPFLGGDQDGVAHEEDVLFSNFHPLVVGITEAKPDFFDGSFSSSLKHQIRASLSKLIVPSNLSVPILPNFFLEVKSLDGSQLVARRQVLHDGSLGARAMDAVRSWGTEPSNDGRACAISMSLCGTVLQIYCTHPVRHEGKTTFHTNRLDIYDLDRSPESLAEAITAFRNARSWAKAERETAIAECNSRWNELSSSSSATLCSSSSATLCSSCSATLPSQDGAIKNHRTKTTTPQKRKLPSGFESTPVSAKVIRKSQS